MASSMHISLVAKIVGVSAVMLLTACSGDQNYLRQVDGGESYLNAPELHPLRAPAGITLPQQAATYTIPNAAQNFPVGKQVDIRPPVQSLALLNGSRTQYSNDQSTLLIENSPQNQALWPRIVAILQQEKIGIASQDDATHKLSTELTTPNRLDSTGAYKGRYQVMLQQQGYQLALSVRSLELQHNGQTVTSAAEIQRYSNMMLNNIVEAIEKQSNSLEYNPSSLKDSVLNVQSSSDDTGLPMLVIRAPYNIVWLRLPDALSSIGMKIADRSRPQGTISVTYNAPSTSDWDKLGAKNPNLDNGEYKIQVGDLGNRSSLQFTDSKGRVLNQSQNDALVAVFQAAFSHPTTK